MVFITFFIYKLRFYNSRQKNYNSISEFPAFRYYLNFNDSKNVIIEKMKFHTLASKNIGDFYDFNENIMKYTIQVIPI